MPSHDDIQLVMYMCMNSEGSSTAVVSRLTTSIECKLMSMLTSTVKYLQLKGEMMNPGKRIQEESTRRHSQKQINMWMEIHTLQFREN